MVGKLKFEMGRDSMSISACILPEGKTEITESMVKQELEMRGVRAGIQPMAIQNLVRYGGYRRSVVLAAGKRAERGKDGYYEFLFDKDAKEYAPTIRDDGSIDYSPNFNMVKKGDKVAVYHPATEGKNGYTIFDSVVAPPKAKEKERLKYSGIQQIGNDFFATMTGRISITMGKLVVEDYLVVQGNAGYGTGGLDFSGDVHVCGDILSDVVIHVGGNLEVDGVIEGAMVTAGKDIIVHHGIHGKEKARIESGGSITTNFIDGAIVRAKNNIVAGNIINAKILAGIGVSVDGKEGTIIGGKVVADEFIRASYVGNDKGFQTILEIRSSDIWSEEYARVVVREKTYPGTIIEINGERIVDCKVENCELHVTERGIEQFGIDEYVYQDVEERFNGQLAGAQDKPLILIVDDDPIFLKTQYSYLSDLYQVAVVSSPHDALLFLEKRCPDLILLDYLMPKMNGGELLKMIRMLPDEGCADVPVFFLTSVTDKNVIVQCLSLYPQGYLIKPLGKDELLKIVGDFFAKNDSN